MIIPRHIKSSADFSPDTLGPDGRGMYRYTLWRRGLLDDDPGAYAQFKDKFVMYVCLNPSTATEHEDDPTVRRCWKRTRAMGYGAFVMTNLFAFRATQPEDMMKAADPVGEDNDLLLEGLAMSAGAVVMAWGLDGAYADRDREVMRLLEPYSDKMGFLATGTASYFPRHPLYLPDDARPIPAKPTWTNFLQRKL